MKKPRYTKEQWQQFLQDQEQSGLKAKAYCQQHQLSYASFSKWRSTLRAEAKQVSNAKFIELTPSHHDPESFRSASERQAWDIELSLGPQVTLRIRGLGS